MEKQIFLSLDEIIEKGKYYDVADFLFELERKKEDEDFRLKIIKKLPEDVLLWALLKFFKLSKDEKESLEQLYRNILDNLIGRKGFRIVQQK
jgi:hypothetical protein